MKKYCFGVDIGGTTVKIGLFSLEGEVLEKWEIPTNTGEGGKYILSDVATALNEKIVEKALDREEFVGIGVGVPGPISKDGVVPHTANLGWKERKDVVGELNTLTGLPVKGGNDANVAALGEMWRGAAKGCENVILLTLGTGVGGGIIVEGRILTGTNGAAGELGHAHIGADVTENCGCGKRGCLEQVASATGIARLGRQVLAESDRESVLRNEEVSAKTVFDGVKVGDALAIETAERFGKYLGEALAIFTAVLDPQTIVIGGGVSKAGPILLEYIQKYYVPVAYKATENVKFALATLGNDAGIYGSAKLIIDEVCK